MFSPRSISLFIALWAAATYAQPSREAPEPVKAEARETPLDAHAQQRRAMLRASLRSQPEVVLVREAPAPTTRLLSDQERAELRQQLRQQ